MHTLSLVLAAAACLAQTVNSTTSVQADPATVVTKAFVQFPASFMTNEWTTDRDKINGYIHVAREKCLQICGSQKGVGYYSHHVINVIPTRMENVAETSCWCCVKDAKGDCYSASNPYSPSSPYGPWTDATNMLLAKLAMKTVGPCTTVNSSAISAIKPVVLDVNTAVPTPGKSIQFHWEGPKSEIGGVYYAYFIDQKKNVQVRQLNNNACTFPAMTGKIAVTVSAAKDPKASSIYIVARTTLNIGTTNQRLKRAMKGSHGIKRSF